MSLRDEDLLKSVAGGELTSRKYHRELRLQNRETAGLDIFRGNYREQISQLLLENLTPTASDHLCGSLITITPNPANLVNDLDDYPHSLAAAPRMPDTCCLIVMSL